MEYRYNRQGQRKQLKDQNGTVHDYLFDKLGRMTEDRATTLGEDVDGLGTDVAGAVRAIQWGYEPRGMVNRITSRDANNDVVDEVFRVYDGLGSLSAEYQDHDSQVSDPPDGPCVQYLYEDDDYPARLTGIVYPDGRELTYGYDSGDDDALGRVSYIADTGGHLAEYTYLGLRQIAEVASPTPGIRWGLFDASTDAYDRIDAFGRTTQQIWTNSGGELVHLDYAYDAAGNRLYREDTKAAAYLDPDEELDELYHYDGLYQLTATERGDLDASDPDPANWQVETNTQSLAQAWNLDALGNWSEFKEGAVAGTWTLDQDRTHNAANEVTGATSWADPHHDRSGNMTRVPNPNALGTALRCTYDAWNHLVKVSKMVGETEQTVAEYRYDGLGRRILKKTYSGGELSETRHFYVSAQNRVLEERVGADAFANARYVWGLRYIDDLVCKTKGSERFS